MYQVFPEEKALVVNFDDPAVVLANIPGAFELEVEGEIVVGLPHGVQQILQLKKLGYDLPSSIEYHYDWPGQHDPFKHQVTTSSFLTSNQRAYCLNDIGTGKTLSALWAADYLMSAGEVSAAIVISPLSTLARVWGDALFYNFQHRKWAILHGSAERRRKLLAQKFDFYIINHDGVNIVKDTLMQRPDINLAIIDELATYRNWGAHKTKDMHKVIYGAGTKTSRAIPWVWGLTGYPIPNAPTDAWAQCRLITPHTVPQYYSQFRTEVMEQHSQYIFVPRKEAIDIVYKAMRPAIRFHRSECLDLPGEVYTTLDVTMSKEQTQAYKEVQRELYTKVGAQEVIAVNEGVKLSKLLQIACGVVYDSNGEELLLPQGDRMDVLKEICEACGEKLIVFAPFRSVLNLIQAELSKHWTVELVHGGISAGQRNRIFGDFQTLARPRIIVADPRCMAHGLTLTEASTTVWYAPIDSNEFYTQANGRTTRTGQKYVANIINLAGSAVERRSYKRLEQRAKVQGVLLEMVAKGEEIL